jgi:hypothetical protein
MSGAEGGKRDYDEVTPLKEGSTAPGESRDRSLLVRAEKGPPPGGGPFEE